MRTSVVHARRGMTIVQVVLVLAVVTVISVGSYYVLGTNASTKLNATATGAGNPSALVSQFNH